MESKSKQFAVVIGLLAVLLTVMVGIKLTQKTMTNSGPGTENINTAKNISQKSASMVLVKNNKVTEIRLKDAGLTINAVAVRLTLDMTMDKEFKITDQDAKKEGIQILPSSVLLAKGWVYPVNKVTVTSDKNNAVVELALVNLNPEGYLTQGDDLLATVNFASSNLLVPNFIFDKVQTKLIAKTGDEIKLDLID